MLFGDALDFARRLCKLNRQYGTKIVISDAARFDLEPDWTLRSVDELHVKGTSALVTVFELLDSGRTELHTRHDEEIDPMSMEQGLTIPCVDCTVLYGPNPECSHCGGSGQLFQAAQMCNFSIQWE